MEGSNVQIVSGWHGLGPASGPQDNRTYNSGASEKLLAFFRSEFHAEERSGFALLKRVPDSRVEESLGWYQSLSSSDKASFVDLVAHRNLSSYGYVINLHPETIKLLESGSHQAFHSVQEELKPSFDVTKHPFFPRWRDVYARFAFRSNRDVPMLRAARSQYKIDRNRGMPSCVSEELFRFAESVKSIKAPELRKQVRATLKKLGYQKTDRSGAHRCAWEGQEFEVDVLGGRNAQLCYGVRPAEYQALRPLGGFCFETALGMGHGHWNYIVEENVDDVSSCSRNSSNMLPFSPDGSRRRPESDAEPWATPLAWATKHGHHEIVQLLRSADDS